MKGGAPLETPGRFCKVAGFTGFLVPRQPFKPATNAEPLRTAGPLVVSTKYLYLASEAEQAL